MGSQLSAPFSSSPPNSPQYQNPKTTSTAIMSSAPETLETQNLNQEQKTQNQEQKTQNQEQETQNQELETQNQKQETQNQKQETQNQEEEEEEEEEEECWLCWYMKQGECKKEYVNFQKCIAEAEKNNEDIVGKCYKATYALKKCMEANPDHYGGILQAEKDAEQQAINQLEQQKQKEKEGVIVDDGTNQEKGKDKEVVAEQES